MLNKIILLSHSNRCTPKKKKKKPLAAKQQNNITASPNFKS